MPSLVMLQYLLNITLYNSHHRIRRSVRPVARIPRCAEEVYSTSPSPTRLARLHFRFLTAVLIPQMNWTDINPCLMGRGNKKKMLLHEFWKATSHERPRVISISGSWNGSQPRIDFCLCFKTIAKYIYTTHCGTSAILNCSHGVISIHIRPFPEQ